MNIKTKFWINFFVGAAAGGLGAFGIGLMVGAAWMFFWPVNLRLTTATGGVLVTIAAAVLTISTRSTKQIVLQIDEERQRSETDAQKSGTHQRSEI